MNKNLAIKINKLFKNYDTVKAVQGIDLKIKKGEFYGLLGPNGAGKSTTINSITSLVKPSDGNIEIFGKNIEKDFRFARSQVGIAQQEVSTDWFFPLEQLLYFQAGFYGVSRSHAKERIEYLLEKLGLSKHRTKKMRELSGGMKRRLQIAKALVHDPEIIILDEPTAGVDVELSTGDLFRHEKGQMFDIKFQVLRGGHLVWQATQSTLCRVVKQPVGEQYRSVMHSETRLSRQASFSIPANIGRRYGKVSGDVNPIHLTNLTARAFGFKRAIAHGMWTKARALSALLPEGITERAMAEVEFKLPLYLPGTVSLWSNRSAKCAKFELRDRQGEKPHLRGQLRFS